MPLLPVGMDNRAVSGSFPFAPPSPNGFPGLKSPARLPARSYEINFIGVPTFLSHKSQLQT